MFLATSLFLIASSQAPSPATYNPFLENLIHFEVVLRLDRRDAQAAKNSKLSIDVLMRDAAAMRTAIQAFQDANLTALPEDTNPALRAFQTSLESFKASLEPAKLLSDAGAALKPENRNCCDHDAAYLKLVASAVRSPGFNMHSLSAPARYNLSPVLYDKPAGLVYADPMVPEAAAVLPRIIQKNSKLKKGDVIVAVRGDDEEEWVPVKTWNDVLHASNDFETGEAKVFIRVKRKSSLKDLVLASSTVIVNTE